VTQRQFNNLSFFKDF